MLIVTIIIATLGGLVSLNQLANLVNIGTLIAFTLISFGVLPLRKRTDISHDGFKVPFYPVLPLLSGFLCLAMMTQLSIETWITSIIWFIIGMVIYFVYGIKHSKISM